VRVGGVVRVMGAVTPVSIPDRSQCVLYTTAFCMLRYVLYVKIRPAQLHNFPSIELLNSRCIPTCIPRGSSAPVSPPPHRCHHLMHSHHLPSCWLRAMTLLCCQLLHCWYWCPDMAAETGAMPRPVFLPHQLPQLPVLWLPGQPGHPSNS
jgi:hypothetical protein